MQLFRSIRFRITALATALVAATLVVASLAILTLVRADLIADAEETLATALEEQAFELEQAYAEATLGPVMDPYVVEVMGLSGFEVAGEAVEFGGFIQDSDGYAYSDVLRANELFATVILDPVTGEVVDFIDPESGVSLENSELAAAVDDVQFGVVEPEFYIDDDEPLAAGDGEPLVVGATSLSGIEASIDALQEALVIIVPMLLAVFAALAWWLVGRALQPVVDITARVDEISSANLDQRVPVPGSGDEVSELAVVMNHMLGRLQRGDERQRQFSADASHELRSPLATLRAAAELIERHGDPERARRLAADIVTESDRMDELIADLLDLARLDEEQATAGHEQVDLVELAEAEAGRAELDGRAAVKVVADETMRPVLGSPRQLRRLTANLVDNACRYAQSNVVVTVSGNENGGAVLTVDDDGPGIASEQTEVIFERFGRVSEARDRDSGGTGLGLALVKAIADHHGAQVNVGRSPEEGARFTVEFPTSGHGARVLAAP